MTPFDFIIAIALTISFLYSMYKGMIREFFSLVGYVAGYLLALKYQSNVAEVFIKIIPNEPVAGIIGYGAIFLATTITVSLIGKLVRNLLHEIAAGLSWIDRLFGGGIGIVKGLVLIVVFLFPVTFFPDFYQKITSDSLIAPHLEEMTQTVGEAVGAPDFLDRLPDVDMEEIKEKLIQLKDLDKLTDELKKINKNDISLNNGKPLDMYTEEDREQLNELLQSVTKG